MINVERKNSFQLRLTRRLKEETSHNLDVYLFVPGELGLSTQLISEEAFYHSAINVSRTYYSDEYLLPLVHSRLASRNRLGSDSYRLSLSLYAYQYVEAMERTTRAMLVSANKLRHARQEEREENREVQQSAVALHDQLHEMIDLSDGILKRLRRHQPDDESFNKYFANIDNYLSWFTEQQLLALVAHMPRGGEFTDIRRRFISVCHREDDYRREQQYNAERVMADPTRMSNKMRLLRRLIEHPITLKQEALELGGGEQKAVKALATAVVMTFVTLGVLQLRSVLGGITALFVLAMALLYAMREVFKDDLRNTLWRWLRKGRPKWRRQYRDPTHNALVGRQLEWFDYKRFAALGEDIQQMRRRKVAQREEVVLHYRSSSRMSPTRFLSGYEHTRETLNLDISMLTRLMSKGKHHIYRLKDGQAVREGVERRHLFNLVIRETGSEDTPYLARWKVVVSRSGIVDVEKVEESSLVDKQPSEKGK
ncbi:hypothetical protein J7J47_12205 [Halomonas sp. ISL-60]|uniref:hypothetical protein n=1 Tax=unclassified Halomonas TaxID=2609666 RepID=UPI0007D98DCE|nr:MULTISPECIES: hypothetical protein [unclassified Halomonas]MBT2772984.1 hypothetical protein [Halomonas sp. ISL-60]MBT2785252.1 hypothetical protein [Halomonas sp. ISL-106]MBT2799273.1 hypothetical protein [Halomonas sp. ISL-104]MBT2800853.1 hypothetical protein [Halomonas sp. ISL-56]OAL59537.1 hypothetical protein A6R74_02550 [Halomonas sp. ALS9]